MQTLTYNWTRSTECITGKATSGNLLEWLIETLCLRFSLGDTISFQQFVKTFSDSYQKPITEAALISAFNVFDPSHSGKLTMTQLHEVLTKRGEPLPKAEVDELMLVAALGSAKQADYALLAKR